MHTERPDVRAVWPYQQAGSTELFEATPGRDTAPQRSIGLRAPTSFPALVSEGAHVARCRAVELSATGIVVDRGRALSEREQRAPMKLDLLLNEQRRIRVLARVVRRVSETSYALRFLAISDVDRLTLMEHLDEEQAESLRLLEEIERAGAA